MFVRVKIDAGCSLNQTNLEEGVNIGRNTTITGQWIDRTLDKLLDEFLDRLLDR